MKKAYLLELFDSRNTSFDSPLHHATTHDEAVYQAKKASRSGEYHHVILHEITGKAWGKYENGERTEWSINSKRAYIA